MIKNYPGAVALVTALFLSALASCWFAVWWFLGARELQALEFQYQSMNQISAAVQSLANDAMEFSRRNPAIDPQTRFRCRSRCSHPRRSKRTQAALTMDPSEHPELLQARPTALPTITIQELEQQCQDLRTLLTATFVALLVLSLSVNLFLAKQMRLVRAKVTESRPVVQRMEAEFKRKEPNMKNFLNALHTFATGNRDFRPVLDRYRASLPQYFVIPDALSSKPSGVKVPTNPAPGSLAPPPPLPGSK